MGHTLNIHDRGGSYPKKVFELFLRDSYRTRRDEHAHMGHSSGRAIFSSYRSLNEGFFRHNMKFFMTTNNIWLPTEPLVYYYNVLVLSWHFCKNRHVDLQWFTSMENKYLSVGLTFWILQPNGWSLNWWNGPVEAQFITIKFIL